MNLGISIKYLRSLMLKFITYRALEAVSCDHCVILCYHRILPKEKVSKTLEPGMYVTPSTFRTHIQFLKNYFEIVTIDQLENIFKKRGNRKFQKPCCVISFDDGWLDFYLYAWPILQEENIPAIVYLPTNLIGTKINFWTDRLAKVFEKISLDILTSHLGINVNRKIFDKITSRREELYQAIELLKEYPYWIIEDLLETFEHLLGIQKNTQNRAFMNWDEVRKLFDTGLISFGSHTAHHAILTTLSAKKIKEELDLSRQKLIEKEVVNNNISFCYPNGNYTVKILKLLANVGYSSAMTCDSGWNIAGDNLLSLKRISLHQDISFTNALFAYRLTQYL